MIKVVVVRAFQFRGGIVRPGAVLALTEKEAADGFVAAHVKDANASSEQQRQEREGRAAGMLDGTVYRGNGQKPGKKKTGMLYGLEERGAGAEGGLAI